MFDTYLWEKLRPVRPILSWGRCAKADPTTHPRFAVWHWWQDRARAAGARLWFPSEQCAPPRCSGARTNGRGEQETKTGRRAALDDGPQVRGRHALPRFRRRLPLRARTGRRRLAPLAAHRDRRRRAFGASRFAGLLCPCFAPVAAWPRVGSRHVVWPRPAWRSGFARAR